MIPCCGAHSGREYRYFSSFIACATGLRDSDMMAGLYLIVFMMALLGNAGLRAPGSLRLWRFGERVSNAKTDSYSGNLPAVAG